MKRTMLLATALVALALPVRADEVVFAADLWCPYNCIPDSDKPGYMVEIAARAFASAGHKFSYKTMPWARALADAASGKITGVFGASPDEAKDLLYPKQPLAQSRNVLAVPAGSPFVWASIKSLEPVALGIIQDYSYGATLDAYIKANLKNPSRIQVLSGDTPLLGNLRKLQAARIGATVDDVNVLTYTLTSENLTNAVRLVDIADAPSPLFIGLSPKPPQAAAYAALLDTTVEALRVSGDLDKILARYGLKDWEKRGS